jgi:hypothetical protein
MTPQQAEQFIIEAEATPLGNIDKERLAEALRVLSEANTGRSVRDSPILMRARALATSVGLTPGFSQAEITADDLSVNDVAAAGLSTGFRRQLMEAAEAIGQSTVTVDTMIAQAETAAAQSGGTFTADQLLESTLEQWETEAVALRGRPIGVDPNFVAQREVTTTSPPVRNTGRPGSTSIPSLPGATTSRVVDVPPQYFEGDQFSPAGLDPAAITRIQTRLVSAGLMEAGEFWAGFWDAQTSDAYKLALGFSNQSGEPVDQTITKLIANLPDSIKERRRQQDVADTFQAPPFLKPDYATLAQDVKGFFRSKVGRDPTDEELAEFTGVMSNMYRREFDARVDAQRAAFEGPPPLDINSPAVTPGGGFVSGGFTVDETQIPAQVVQDVDPAARFRESFERRFGPEIDRLASLDDVYANTNNMFASLRTMNNLIGGR